MKKLIENNMLQINKKWLIIAGLSVFLLSNEIRSQVNADSEATNFQKKKNAEAAFNKGITNVKSGNYNGALTCFNDAVNCDPTFVNALIYRAKTKFQLNNLKGSNDDLNSALKLNSSCGEAYFCLGYYQLVTDTATAQIDLFDKAIQNSFVEPEAYYYRAVLKTYKKDYQGAQTDFSTAVEKKPDYALAYFDRGNVRITIGDFQGAIYDFRQSLSIDSTMIASYNNMAIAKIRTADYQGAVADLNKLISLQPKNFQAFNNRGNARYLSGELTSAMEDFKLAVELNADYAPGYIGIGIILAKSNDNKGAVEQFSKALKLNANLADAYLNRGFSKEMLGDIDGACNDWKSAAALGNQDANVFIKECK